MAFKVTNIKDAETIEVTPKWAWREKVGNEVKIKGFSFQSSSASFVIHKLSTLLKDKEVELKNPDFLDEKNSVIKCSVFLNEVDIAKYFPELNASL